MRSFAYSVLLGAVGTIGVNAQDGSICVESLLVDLFNAVNELRADGASSTVGTFLDGVSSGTYDYADTTSIGVLMGQTAVDAANTDITNASALDPIEWSEGLALGATALYDAWIAHPAVESTNAGDGSTTSTRALINGTYTS